MAKQSKLELVITEKKEKKEKDKKSDESAEMTKPSELLLSERDVYSVKGITYRIKRTLEQNKDLQDLWIGGEISNFTKHSSGHLYFTLKDEEAILSCIQFKGAGKKLRFELNQGIMVVAHGHISVYAQQGKYQLIVDEIRPYGLGALHMAFIQLKEKLAKEGLFDDIHKKPLPEFPKTSGKKHIKQFSMHSKNRYWRYRMAKEAVRH